MWPAVTPHVTKRPRGGQRVGRGAPDGCADRVAHHLDAAAAGQLAHARGDVLVVVVDGPVCAEVERLLALVRGARGGDHAAARRLRDLQREAADAASGGDHEHGLTGLDTRLLDERAVRAAARRRRGSRLVEREVVGNRERARCGCERQLGVRRRGGAEDPLPHLEAPDLAPKALDHTREVAPADVAITDHALPVRAPRG